MCLPVSECIYVCVCLRVCTYVCRICLVDDCPAEGLS